MPPQLLRRPKGPTISDELRKKYEAQAEAEQAKQPLWKQYINKGIESGVGAVEGLLGSEFEPGAPTTRDKANFTAQLLSTLIPILGVTKYLKAGVPDVEARKLATQDFINKFGSEYKWMGEKIAQRHPRVAAHTNIRLDKHPEGKSEEGVALIQHAFNKDFPEQVPVIISDWKDPKGLENSVVHEMTHVAQTLGTGNPEALADVYGMANLMPARVGVDDWSAYINNPLERSARAVAFRKTGYNPYPEIQESDKPYKAIEGLKRLFQNIPMSGFERHLIDARLNRQKVDPQVAYEELQRRLRDIE